jgi:hypothetical protein
MERRSFLTSLAGLLALPAISLAKNTQINDIESVIKKHGYFLWTIKQHPQGNCGLIDYITTLTPHYHVHDIVCFRDFRGADYHPYGGNLSIDTNILDVFANDTSGPEFYISTGTSRVGWQGNTCEEMSIFLNTLPKIDGKKYFPAPKEWGWIN